MIKEIYFDSIDSTNTYLKNNYQKYKDFTIVRASFQTNGHGRMGRSFEGNSESLMFSMLLKNKKYLNDFASISIKASVSVAKTLESLNINNVMIKWPNDVYANGKKICGILLESTSSKSGLENLVVGIGININNKKFIDKFIHPATSIYLELGKELDINNIKDIFYKNLISEVKKNNLKYLDYVNNHNYLYNKDCYASINNQKELVKILNINNDNTLKVLHNGKEINVLSDEISFHL